MSDGMRWARVMGALSLRPLPCPERRRRPKDVDSHPALSPLSFRFNDLRRVISRALKLRIHLSLNSCQSVSLNFALWIPASEPEGA